MTRTRLVATAVVLTVVAALVPATTVAAGERTPTSTTSTSEAPEPPDIIPEPNSGAEPTEAGDRGGALQLAVFGLMVLGVAAIAALVVRESRKAKDRASP